MTPSKKKSSKLILIFLSGLFFLEVILRAFGVRPHIPLRNSSGPFRKDSNLKWGFKPSYEGKLGKVYIRTNSFGFRGAEVLEKKPGEFRILALGGSVTAGTDVQENETYVVKLEDLLERSLNRPVSVINAGVPGYSPYQYIYLLREFGPKFQADLVLLDFAINDVLESRAKPSGANVKPEFRMNDAFLSLEAGLSRKQIIWNKVSNIPRHFAVYTTYFWIKKKVKKLLFKEEGNFFAWMEGELLSETPSDFVEESWKNTRTEVLEIRSLATTQKAQFAMVIFPLRQQIQDENKMDRPQRLMREFSKKEKITLIDLLPAFRAQKSTPDIFIDSNHIAPRGHTLVAETIENGLRNLVK